MQNFKRPQPYFHDEQNNGSWYERDRYEEMRMNDSIPNNRMPQRSSFGPGNQGILSSSYGPDNYSSKFMPDDGGRRFNNNHNNSSSQMQFNNSREYDDMKDARWCRYENNHSFPGDSYENGRDFSDDFMNSDQLDDDYIVPRGHDRFHPPGRWMNQPPKNMAGQRFPPNPRFNLDSFNRPSSDEAGFQRFVNNSPQGSDANFRRPSVGFPNQFQRGLNRRKKVNVRKQSPGSKKTSDDCTEMDISEDYPSVKRMKREYSIKIDPSLATKVTSPKRPPVKPPVKPPATQTKKLGTSVDGKHACVPCNKKFITEAILKEHNATPNHITLLKSYIKKNLATLYDYSKELDGLINTKEESIHPAVCGLCDTYNRNTKTHKWSLVHMLRLLDGPGVPVSNQVNPKDFESEEKAEDADSSMKLVGLEHVIPFAGHFCKICRRICQTKSAHCLSKKHIHFVQRIEDRKNAKSQKDAEASAETSAVPGAEADVEAIETDADADASIDKEDESKNGVAGIKVET